MKGARMGLKVVADHTFFDLIAGFIEGFITRYPICPLGWRFNL